MEFRVLLVAPNWLGDAVMFSALIEYLHQNRILPDGTNLSLSLAVRPAWLPLFANDLRLTSTFSVYRPGRHGGILGGPRLGLDFRALSPHAVVLGPPSLRAGVAAFFSGANLRIGYSSDRRSSLLTHSLKSLPRGEKHHSQELVQLGRTLFKCLGWDELYKKDAVVEPSLPGCDKLRTACSHASTPIWVFAPGATYGSAKSWPENKAIEFIRLAVFERKVRLVIVGDAAASVYARQVADALSLKPESKISGPHGLVDLTGQTNLSEVAALLKSCEVFVGNDSGLMHLAAALQVATIGIFGSSNPDWTNPRGRFSKALVAKGFDCRPCYLKTCNNDKFCLDTIDSHEVMAAVDELITFKKNGFV